MANKAHFDDPGRLLNDYIQLGIFCGAGQNLAINALRMSMYSSHDAPKALYCGYLGRLESDTSSGFRRDHNVLVSSESRFTPCVCWVQNLKLNTALFY